MSRRRDTHMQFLSDALDATMLKPSQLASKAGLSPSALTRFLAGKTDELAERTLTKISAVSGVPTPFQAGLSENEVVPFKGAIEPTPDPSALVSDTFAMVVQGTSLEDVGILPGDILFFDRARRPQPNDVVILQSYDMRQASAQTLIRQYDPPFLIGRSRAPVKPIMLTEGGPVMVIGVLTRQVRDRVWSKQA